MTASKNLLPAALRNQTSFVLIKLAALLRQDCTEQLAGTGLSQHQHAILCSLDEYGPACQKDIADRLGIDGGDTVAFVDGLDQGGLITRDATSATADVRSSPSPRPAGERYGESRSCLKRPSSAYSPR